MLSLELAYSGVRDVDGREGWWQNMVVVELGGGGGGRQGWWQRWWQDRRDLKEPVPTYKETCLRVSSFILFTAFLSLSLSFLPSFIPFFLCLFLLFFHISPFSFYFFVCVSCYVSPSFIYFLLSLSSYVSFLYSVILSLFSWTLLICPHFHFLLLFSVHSLSFQYSFLSYPIPSFHSFSLSLRSFLLNFLSLIKQSL